MLGITGGILNLGRAQGPLQPVGAGLILGQIDIQQRTDQSGVAHGKVHAEKGCRKLGIEQRRGQRAAQPGKDLKILTACMQDLDYRSILKQRDKGRPVANTQRINERGALAIANLDQTGNRVKCLGANKFGINGNEGQPTPLVAAACQLGVIINHYGLR